MVPVTTNQMAISCGDFPLKNSDPPQRRLAGRSETRVPSRAGATSEAPPVPGISADGMDFDLQNVEDLNPSPMEVL